MEERQIAQTQLLDCLGPGVTLVTVNQRLARYLRSAYDARQLARGLEVWEIPDILPWSAWLQRCWETLVSVGKERRVPVLLNAHQEQVLWEQIVAREDHPLLQVSAAAQTAREAWGLLHAWELDLDQYAGARSVDAFAFERWSALYSRLCDQNVWLDSARLTAAVCARLLGDATVSREHLLVVGFDALTPAQSAVLTRLEDRGSKVTVVAPVSLDGDERIRVSLPSAEEEARAAAYWIRRLLERAPHLGIGIAVPDLATYRVQLQNIFDAVLIPEAVVSASDKPMRPYNLSLGQPLTDRPLVKAALLALDFARGPMATERVGSLLRSPFVAGAETEMTRRALLDAHLRQLREPRVSMETLSRQASLTTSDGSKAFACPVLAACLGRISGEADIYRQLKPASEWVEVFAGILRHLGWPGERSLDSAEFQTVQAWREMLFDLSSLDAVSPVLSFEQALSRLRGLAQSKTFQPRSFDVPVQVLGLLEMAGTEFDYLWVMGLHGEAWPTAPHPNPFLPINLQRRQNLPHATADRELEFARTVTRRFLGSARHVVCSYPVQDGERVLRPSPLIVSLREQPVESLELSGPAHFAASVQETGALAYLSDDSGPPVLSVGGLSGGTAILQDQAACPFRAFAKHRLGARELEAVPVGLDPRARGSLVHAALFAVWAALGSHAELCALSSPALDEIVVAAVRKAVREMARRRPLTFTERFTLLEEARLVRLISIWLETEKGRSPFLVAGREQGRVVEIAGLRLDTRPDRIDRLLDGGLAVIDYKTGKTSRGKWFGERPDEPQLPVYAITSDEPVDAVFFARLQPDDMGFEGVARRTNIVPGGRAFADTPDAVDYGSWERLISAWRSELEGLARSFLAGYAAVSPKKYPQTCEYCELGTFCRIGERISPGEEMLDGGEA